MAEFKCISCGAVKESEKPCSCPVCGYKMFETPYERAEIFRKEIKDFIAHLKLSEIPEQSFEIYRKEPKKKDPESQEFDIIKKADDDSRFPVFAKIQGYGWLGKQAVLFVDHILSFSEYTNFYKLLSNEYAEGSQKEAVRLLPSKSEEIIEPINIVEEAEESKEDANDAALDVVQPETKEPKKVLAPFVAVGKAFKKAIDGGVKTINKVSDDINAASKSKDIEDQQYTCLILLFYLDALASFLGLNEEQ